MGRCRGNLGREIGVTLIGHALRILVIVFVGGLVFNLCRSGRRQNIQTGCRIERGLCVRLRGSNRGSDRLGGSNSRIRRGRRLLCNGSRLRLKRRLLALFVIKRAGLGQHAERTDGIRTKADIASGIAIEFGLGLGNFDHHGLLRRLGGGLFLGGHFGLGSLVLSLGRDNADQRLVGRGTLKTIDLPIKSLFLLGHIVRRHRLAKLVLVVGRFLIFNGVAVVVLLLGRGILGRRARHLLGATLLLAKIGIEWNVVGELVFALIRGNVVHDTEHGGNRGLVAHRARRVGKHKTVGDDIGGVGQCHKGGQNRNNPQQHLEHAGKRQDTQDGDSRGCDRGDRQELGDKRAIRSVGLASKELGAGRIIVRHHDDRAVARRRKRARGLVIGDDILTHTGLSQARNHGMPRALEHIEHGTDNGQQGADQADTAADAHQQGAGKRQNTGNGKRQPAGRGSIKFLHLGVKAVVAENLSDILGSQALFFTARRRNAGVLQQVVNIVLGVRHVRSTSIIRQIGPMHAH